ncbi:flavocytochrome c [Nicoliella spurrieriana]|uniref:Flavocytochrome c n=1 Tax=Nicoliella spurrieriana TaxID=2925830 RepID=A0A976X6H7_9LACO|nr:flavocytochrome c [Nicoliella spurrieriana]UQS87332.1 flavocytochrome c [Nicoliella spurrieriana]
MVKTKFQPNPITQLADYYDLIIVGSGATGLVAALQAYELGLHPVILEKMAQLGGNTNRASSGMNAAETEVQLKHHIVDSFAAFYDDTLNGGDRQNNPELLHYFTTHAALAVDWLADHDIELDDVTITGGMGTKRTHRPSSMAPIGNFLVTALLNLIQEAQIPVFTQVTVQKIRMNAKQVCGVSAELFDGTNRQINGAAVILATGGFGANQQLIGSYRPDLVHYRTTNQPGATGDGLTLATDVGAALVDMEKIQVHPTVQQDHDHAFLIGEAVRGEGAILVDRTGHRFVNELATRKMVTAAINTRPEHDAYLILDQGVRDHAKAIEFYDSIGLVIHGSDLASLAANIGVDETNLRTTVEQWNQAVAIHTDAQFHRTTGMDRQLNQPPFFAIHVKPAVHYTMGGLKVNHQTEVLNSAAEPIAGLFAGGEVAGGLHGDNRIGGNSIAETVVFGRQAGQQAFRYLQNSNK